jgi:hypothetical protein
LQTSRLLCGGVVAHMNRGASTSLMIASQDGSLSSPKLSGTEILTT